MEFDERLAGYIKYIKTRDPSRANFRIHIIAGLPEIHFCGVLAREMLHSWFALYGREITEDECEGFCNLGKTFIYENDKDQHANHLLRKMYNNADLIYGESYRLQKGRFERLGGEWFAPLS